MVSGTVGLVICFWSPWNCWSSDRFGFASVVSVSGSAELVGDSTCLMRGVATCMWHVFLVCSWILGVWLSSLV